MLFTMRVHHLAREIVRVRIGAHPMERISVTILGSYDALADLTAAHPTGNIGDSYSVGDDLYVWNAADNNWVNVGNIKESKGKTGKPRSARFIPLKEVARRVRKHPST